MTNSSIWLIDMTLPGATTWGQSGPGSDGNEGVLLILQSSSITGASLSNDLMSYPEHPLVEGSYPPPPLQRSSRSIIQPQPTGQNETVYKQMMNGA